MADKQVIEITASQTMHIPSGLKLGVQGDNEVTRLYFSCPRYPSDDVDLYAFPAKYFTYVTPNGTVATPLLVQNEKTEGDALTFDVPVTGDMTKYAGSVGIALCFKNGALDWNVHNAEIECMSGYHVDNPIQQYPDLAQQIATLISQGGELLTKLQNVDSATQNLISNGNAVIASVDPIVEKAAASAEQADAAVAEIKDEREACIEATNNATAATEAAETATTKATAAAENANTAADAANAAAESADTAADAANKAVNSIDAKVTMSTAQATADTKTDVETLKTQLSTLVAATGETDGNSELQDIRAGADGVSYKTAGEAVRTQLNAKIAKTDAMSWEQWFDLHRTGWHGGVTYATGSSSPIGTKTGDNAELVVIPSTRTEANRDDYDGNLMWSGISVNGYIDSDGDPHITAIEGSPEYKTDGSNGDCYRAFLTGFYNAKLYCEAEGSWDWRDTPADGYIPHPKAIRPDGSYRSFYFIARYPMSIDSSGLPASVSGAKVRIRDVSHNSLVTTCRKKGEQYCGLTTSDVFWFQSTFEMKYGTKAMRTVFKGATEYSVQAAATVEETGVKRVIVSKSDAAKFLVGSYVMVGYGTASSGAISLDRQNANTYKYGDSMKILSVEEYDSSNSAITVDVENEFDTTSVVLTDTLTSPVYITSATWKTGACDDILGNDGSPFNALSGKEVFSLSGVEIGHGAYEILADIKVQFTSTSGVITGAAYIVDDAAKITSGDGATTGYTKLDITIPQFNWAYGSGYTADPAYPFFKVQTEGKGSSSTYYGNATYSNTNAGWREWQWFGRLDLWSFAGLRYAALNGWLGSAWWYIASRLSSLRRGVNPA